MTARKLPTSSVPSQAAKSQPSDSHRQQAITSTTTDCPWDGRPVKPRAGGKRKQYCCKECRHAHRAAKHAWAEEQVRSGTVSLPDLQAALARKRGEA
jgi:hypothetical protein